MEVKAEKNEWLMSIGELIYTVNFGTVNKLILYWFEYIQFYVKRA